MPDFKLENFKDKKIENIEIIFLDNVETIKITCSNGNSLQIYPSIGHGLNYHKRISEKC